MDLYRIAYDRLCLRVSRRLEAAGVRTDLAQLEAQIMAESDLLGVPSHGVRMLPALLKAMDEGRVKPDPRCQLHREFGATGVFDADLGPGRSTSSLAMDDAVARARLFGIGACLAIHTSHWGRAHAYAGRAAAQGMIGLCTTNAMPSMAVGGSTQRVLGNNPLAIGIPRTEAAEPLVLDLAMSQAAVGKVGTALREEQPVPLGWGLDSEGQPSTDPRAILAGAVLPFGGHKGAGLALMMELLTAGLGGGPLGYEIAGSDASGVDPGATKLFVALNPAAFGGLKTLRARVDDCLSYLGSAAAPYLWPGERGWSTRRENLDLGVPLHSEIVAELGRAGVILS